METMTMAKKPSKAELRELFKSASGGNTLGDICEVSRDKLNEQDRPAGECWACEKFAVKALIHESPGKAKCCIGCDAYKS
jgi:hypothetical protein